MIPVPNPFYRRYYDTIHSHWETSGHFKFDKKNEGEIKEFEDEDGHLYIGEVKEGTDTTKHGIGIEIWGTGRFIEGHWEDGTLHGRARVIYSYGDVEEYSLDHGKKHGYRVWTSSDGSKEVQEWNHDTLVGKYEHRLSMSELLAQAEEEFGAQT